MSSEKEKGRWVSPNDMMKEAKEQMLEGRVPSTRKDWMLVVNFVAANVQKGLEVDCCKIFRLIFDIPLSENDVYEIAQYQLARKKK